MMSRTARTWSSIQYIKSIRASQSYVVLHTALLLFIESRRSLIYEYVLTQNCFCIENLGKKSILVLPCFWLLLLDRRPVVWITKKLVLGKVKRNNTYNNGISHLFQSFFLTKSTVVSIYSVLFVFFLVGWVRIHICTDVYVSACYFLVSRRKKMYVKKIN